MKPIKKKEEMFEVKYAALWLRVGDVTPCSDNIRIQLLTDCLV